MSAAALASEGVTQPALGLLGLAAGQLRDACVPLCEKPCSSSLLSASLNIVNKDPNDPTIRAEFMKWVKAGGKTLQGLIRRREAEANLYFTK